MEPQWLRETQMIRSLLNQFSSILLALLFGIIIWSVAKGEENPSQKGSFFNLPITVVNLPDGMAILQRSADKVTINVHAPKASWSPNQLSADSFRVLVDLSGKGAGLHQVPVTVQSADPQVVIEKIEPNPIGIRLDPLKARTIDVHADVLDSAPVGFAAKPPVTVPPQATISGAAVMVDQVTEVSADIFLRGAKAPFDREVALVARDAQGNAVKDVTITPASVAVSVQVEQRVGYKDVSVKATLKGAPASGYWVSNITVDPSTVTVVGSADALGKMPGYIETLPIDVTGATQDITKRTTFGLPEGVSVLNNDGVAVQVSVTPILGGQTVRRKVIVQGLRPGMTATASPDQLDVILSGPVPALQGLQPSDVQVVVDATDKTAGTYQVRPRVPIVPDSLKVQSIVPDTVLVTISDVKASITPTLPLTGSMPVSSIGSTPVITPTLVLTETLPTSLTLPVPTLSK